MQSFRVRPSLREHGREKVKDKTPLNRPVDPNLQWIITQGGVRVLIWAINST